MIAQQSSKDAIDGLAMATQRQIAELTDTIATERTGRREELNTAVSQLNAHIRDVKDVVSVRDVTWHGHARCFGFLYQTRTSEDYVFIWCFGWKIDRCRWHHLLFGVLLMWRRECRRTVAALSASFHLLNHLCSAVIFVLCAGEPGRQGSYH